jgi:hypothetical protein
LLYVEGLNWRGVIDRFGLLLRGLTRERDNPVVEVRKFR